MREKKEEVKEEVFERGLVNMELKLKNGESKKFAGPLMSSCVEQAREFCKENGREFRSLTHDDSWEAI
jgi:hypothetical protein